MYKILLWTLVLEGFLARYGADKPPPETILPGDSIKPRVSLSLLSPDSPHEGDDVLLQCSAKPKNNSKATQPDNVHWIKGNVGVTEQGHKPEAKRFVRDKSKDDDGSILFTLTIKEVEVADADKYMCIVQVGETGYFTSNEVQVDVEPEDPEVKKTKKESKKQKEEQDLEDILSWKDRLSELTPDELKIYAEAYLENEQIMEAQKKAEAEEKEREAKEEEEKSASKTTTEESADVEELTEEDKDLLERRDEIADMSELELFKLSQALKKEKIIKKLAERKKRESKEEKERRWRKALKQQEEEEARKAEEKRIAEEKRREAEERFKLTPEEEAILKRQDELADFTGKEIKLLHKALAKQKTVEKRPFFELDTEEEEEETEDEEADEFAEPVLTEEEQAIFARKDEIRDMTQEELKIMASAVTKQKKIQEVRRKKYNVQWPDEDEQGTEGKKVEKPVKKSLADQAKEPITAEELLMVLKQDHVMDLTNDELPFLARGLKKLQYLEDSDPNVADDMSTDEMFEILAKKDKIVDMEQDDLDLYLLAMVKEKNIKFGRKEAPKKKQPKLSDEEDKPFTNEEVAMLLRRNDVANLEHDELPILARALTKQDYRDKNDPTVGNDLTEKEMAKLLNQGKDEIMKMNQKELDLYVAALIRQRKNRIKPRKKAEDEMTVAEMNRILKWQDERDISDLSQDELSQLGTALLKQKKIKEDKQNDPLEGEHDEL